MSVGKWNTLWAIIFVIAVVWAISAAQAEGAVPRRDSRLSGYSVRSEVAIRSVFGKRAAAALRVARCESRMNPRAVGSAGERGLFQIHPIHFGWAKPKRLFEPRWNALVAYRLSRSGTNWSHWTCRWAA